jgi:hypothetical protein
MPVRNSKGTAAVEFGLILPLLVLLVVGTIEFGFILYDKAVITNASREGARYGSMYRTAAVSSDDIGAVVDDYCADYLISLGSPQTVSRTVTGDCSVPDSELIVDVTYPYDFLVLPNFVNSLLGTITLNAETVMRCENHS